MAGTQIGMPGGSISMSNRTADKLIDHGSGDAALLFLHLLRTGGYYDTQAAAKALSWTNDRVVSAFESLQSIDLVKGVEVEKAPVISAKDAPEYTVEDISAEMAQQNSSFPALLAEVERKLGAKLSYKNLTMLMELYDYLALPPEVIYTLVTYMCSDSSGRKSPGKPPRMWEIKREGYRWAQKGLDTLESATAYVEKMQYFHSQEGRILAIVGSRDRQAVPQERAYINSWLEMGFTEEVIQMAYEKTLFNIGKWSWNYANGILKSWHSKGLTTAAQVMDEERPRTAGTAAPAQSSQTRQPRGRQVQPAANALPPDSPQFDDSAWLDAFMKNYNQTGSGK